MSEGYQKINAESVDRWCAEGWEWGEPITHETFKKAERGEWGVYLTPTKYVPHEWFGELKDKNILGLASGGGIYFDKYLRGYKRRRKFTRV